MELIFGKKKLICKPLTHSAGATDNPHVPFHQSSYVGLLVKLF